MCILIFENREIRELLFFVVIFFRNFLKVILYIGKFKGMNKSEL